MRAYAREYMDLRNARKRARRKANPGWGTEQQIAWFHRNQTRAMLYQAKHRAKNLGVPFNLTIEDIVIPEVCPVDGLPFENGRGKGKKGCRRSPSLDRIIPVLGYVKGNVQVIAHIWNARKHDMVVEDLRKLLAYMEGDMTRAFHGRQGTASALANQAPGFVDPARTAKSPANTVTPVTAAASMHDDLGQEAVQLANGSTNVPTHPAMTPTEGQDTQETQGDSQTRAGMIVVKGANPRGTPG